MIPAAQNGNPYHLNAPHQRAHEESEEIDVGQKHHQNADPVETRQDVALEPVVRRALAVLLEHSGLANRLPIVEGSLQHDIAKPFHQWAVRIALPVRECVMLSGGRPPIPW